MPWCNPSEDLSGMAEVGHVVEVGAAAKQVTDGTDEHIEQVVIAAVTCPRIGQVFGRLDQTEFRRGLHPPPCTHKSFLYNATVTTPSFS